ncbi:hypothetical protein EDB85DRAFT_1889239 [Lactarius pseudohatsudake]|nr:hypothetical protein EDB85DRAFT_1889239 [Lactarius pseudohatsudake]
MWKEEFMFVSNLCLLIAVQWARGRSHLPWWHENIFEQEKTEQVIMFLPSHPWLNLVTEIASDQTTPIPEAKPKDEILYEQCQGIVERFASRLHETSHQQHLSNAQMCERKCEKNKERKQNGQTPAHKANEGKLNDQFGIIVSDWETKMNLSIKQWERL